jgi:hypothetical protein
MKCLFKYFAYLKFGIFVFIIAEVEVFFHILDKYSLLDICLEIIFFLVCNLYFPFFNSVFWEAKDFI